MSPLSSATSVVGSSASAVAERVSPPNMASSPKMAPGRSSASATVRPSMCSRRRCYRAGADDVTGVAVVALTEDDLAALERARHRHLGDLHQLAFFQLREDLGVGEQGRCVLPFLHRRIIT